MLHNISSKLNLFLIRRGALNSRYNTTFRTGRCISRFDSQQKRQISFFVKKSRPSLSHIQLESGSLSPSLKRPGHYPRAHFHLLLKLIMSGAIPPLPHMPSWRAQGQIYLCIYLNFLVNVILISYFRFKL
jgi:hypothetical protein